jgi:ATP-binding cassette, subfamily C, bacterial CydD
VRPLDPRLLRRVRGARLALWADIALGLLATIALLTQAVLFAGIVADAFEGRTLPAVTGKLMLLAAIVVVRAVLAGAFEATGRRAATGVMSELRRTLVERRLRDAPRAADGVEAGEAATAAVQGVDALETYFARYLPQVVLALLVPAMVLVWTAVIDPISALIMLVTLPLIPVFMVVIGRFTDSATRARWVALSRLSNHFLDVVRGLPTLRAFNRGEAQTERIEAASEEYRTTTMQVLRVSFLSGSVLELMATVATALVAVTLGLRLIDGVVGLRSALAVLLLTPELYAPLRGLAAQFHASADGLAAAERILDLLDAGRRAPRGTHEPPGSWEVVGLEGVTVLGRAGAVLDEFDLEIRRGEVVALVGPSGSGKSTVASLLLGLRAPDGGVVMVDGTDLASIEHAAWMREVSWLPQRPTLFRGTVRDNVLLGDPSAPESRLEAAVRLAGAAAFIVELRHGDRTRIGEGGRSLSAGETRRLALARALVRETPLLILDEPTANLDVESADLIARSIRVAAQGRAVLLIEHRPELARLADRIVRIEDGKAIQMAKELVAR